MVEALKEPAEILLNRHIKSQKMWFPHELVPFDLATNFDNKPWAEDDYPLAEAIRSSIYVNLLTEDNLPYYSPTIISKTIGSSALLEWGHIWTAEEARHSEVIREWVHATRAIDPTWLEVGRMAQMTKAEVPNPRDLLELSVYTSFQELATNVAHSKTSSALDGLRWGKKVMATVAGDEIKHHKFYRDLAGAILLIEPSETIIAIHRQLRNFDMPGTGIPEFERHAKLIAEAGMFNITHLVDLVFVPTLNHWKIDEVEDSKLTDEAKIAREAIYSRIETLRKMSNRFKQHIADKKGKDQQ